MQPSHATDLSGARGCPCVAPYARRLVVRGTKAWRGQGSDRKPQPRAQRGDRV